MKKILTLLITMFLILPLLSCDKDKYVMPYKPGVTIEEEEKFYEYKTKWDEANLSNYTFTFTKKHSLYPPDNYVIEVTAENGKVTNCELKEYISQSKEDASSEEWAENEERFSSSHSNLDQFLIDNIYSTFDRLIKEDYESLKKHPDCYYANFSFTFSEEVPFILSYEGRYLLMIKDADGNGAELKFQISNFEAK